jgi:outer membrane lipoprotein SlyB
LRDISIDELEYVSGGDFWHDAANTIGAGIGGAIAGNWGAVAGWFFAEALQFRLSPEGTQYDHPEYWIYS